MKLPQRGPNSSDVLAEAELLCLHLDAQDAALDQLHAHVDEQGEVLRAIHAEVEAHICPATQALQEAVVHLQDSHAALLERVLTELQWLRNKSERMDGRLERLELCFAAHVPDYPRTQLQALPEARARVEGSA